MAVPFHVPVAIVPTVTRELSPTYPVQLVSAPDAGVPRTGVTRVGLVANTKEPLPVSSEITPANWAEVVAARTERLFVV